MAKSTEQSTPIKRGFHHGRGIRNRWLRNSFLIVSAILLAVVVVLSFVICRYYYNSMRSGLETKVKTVSDFFASYATNESEYQWMAEYYVTDFDEKDRLELQFLTVEAEPSVFLSSSGLTSGSKPNTTDITQAISTGDIAPGPAGTRPPGSGSWRCPPPLSTTARSRVCCGWLPLCGWWTGSWPCW